MHLSGGRESSRDTEKDPIPVSMIHKRNPYSDIPSLYDMYVQAAVRDREPERFGLDVFRNGTRAMDVVPMDFRSVPIMSSGPATGCQ